MADSVRYAMFHVKGDAKDETLRAELGEEGFAAAALQSGMFRMLVFYALEYVVVEGYVKGKDKDASIDALLIDDMVNKLRRFRNSVFHPQEDPLTKKLWDFLRTPDSEMWIKNLHKAFESYFVARLPIEEHLARAKASGVAKRA